MMQYCLFWDYSPDMFETCIVFCLSNPVLIDAEVFVTLKLLFNIIIFLPGS